MNRLFNIANFTRVILIFIIGFVSRTLINYLININVFVDYIDHIPIFYYIILSCSVVFTNDFVSYFQFIFSSFKFLPLNKIPIEGTCDNKFNNLYKFKIDGNQQFYIEDNNVNKLNCKDKTRRFVQ
jgi:hypothetical protein